MPLAPSDLLKRRSVTVLKCLTSGAMCAVVAAAGLFSFASPAVAENGSDGLLEECPPGIVDADEPSASSIDAAMNLAVLCGFEVEVLDERDEWSQSFATPEGDVRLESAVEPQRAVDEAGNWAPIDTTLTLGPDRAVRPVNTVRGMAFSAGGTTPLVSMEFAPGESMVFDWPGELPEPELAGPAARYAEVLPGVDLIVEATPVGFRHDLVVHDAESAANPELESIDFTLVAAGLAAEQTDDRVVSLLDDEGFAVTSTVPPTMWDSPAGDGDPQALTLSGMAEEPSNSVQQIAEVDVALEGEMLSLLPDLDLLRGAATVFPVVIDPQWDGGIRGNDWGMAIAKSTTKSSSFYRGLNNSGNPYLSNVSVQGNAGAGYTCDSWSSLTCSSERYQIQSFFRMDTATITRGANDGDRIATSAKFKIQQKFSASCSNGQARVHRTANYTSSVTWNTRPVSRGQAATTSSADHGSTCGGPEYVSFNVSDMVHSAEVNEWYSVTVGMWRWELSPSTDLLHWNRFDSSTAVLEIQYDYRAGLPTDRRTETRACKEYPDAEWVTTAQPKLSAKPNAPSSAGGVGIEFRVYEPYSGGALLKSWKVSGKPGATVTTTIPAGVIPSDGLYRWSARTYVDGNHSATREPLCYFEVDTSAPEPPDIVQMTDQPGQGEPVTFEILGGEDVSQIQYGLQGDSTTTESALNGRVTVTVTPTSGSIDHVLQAWAIDTAGNSSSRTDAAFTTAKTLVPEPVSAWRFDETGRDDATGHDLDSPAGLVYSTDRLGRSEAAADLDAAESSCISAEGPLVEMSDSFTVAAWVKPDAGSNDWPKVFSQAGVVRGSFYLEWSQATNRWNFTMAATDAEDTAWARAYSPEPPRIGEWQHVAGVYDAAAERMRLYIDGALVASDAVEFDPWQSAGSLTVGCAQRTNGSVFSVLDGAIDDAAVFASALSSDQVAALTDGVGLPAAEAAVWPLRESADGDDTVNPGLTIPGGTVWTEDAFGRANTAIDLPGTAGQCLTADAPVRSDEPFTASAWVRLDADHVHQHPRVFSFRGDQAFSVMLKYNAGTAYWNLSVRDEDSDTAVWNGAISDEPAAVGEWTHLAVTVNPDAGRSALFVDGVLSDERTLDFIPWRSDDFTIGCGGTVAEDGVSLWDGAISDVRLWHGIASPEQIWDLGLEQRSYWELSEDLGGTDSWGEHDLSFNGAYEWIEDRYAQCNAAYGLDLDGEAWAQTTSGGPVVTDESFTVSVWARLDSLEGNHTIMSQTAGSRSSFYLRYHTDQETWRFEMPDAGTGDTGWSGVWATETPEVGTWYHLAAVWDQATGQMRLYVDGELQGADRGPEHPWHVDGELLIGAAGDNDGDRWGLLSGAVDQVLVYGGVASEDWIEILAANRPRKPVDPTDCDW